MLNNPKIRALINASLILTCFLVIAITSISRSEWYSLFISGVLAILLDWRTYREYRKSMAINRLFSGQPIPTAEFNKLMDEARKK